MRKYIKLTVNTDWEERFFVVSDRAMRGAAEVGLHMKVSLYLKYNET